MLWCYALQGAGSAVWLLPVPYFSAPNGGAVSFSINLWFKAGNTTGELFQYLFSHNGNADGDDWGPNQVRDYPETPSILLMPIKHKLCIFLVQSTCEQDASKQIEVSLPCAGMPLLLFCTSPSCAGSWLDPGNH